MVSLDYDELIDTLAEGIYDERVDDFTEQCDTDFRPEAATLYWAAKRLGIADEVNALANSRWRNYLADLEPDEDWPKEDLDWRILWNGKDLLDE